jgi:uncharacterized protein (DUF433 family)
VTSRTEHQQSSELSPNHPYVHEVPGVCGGYPVIRNTRIMVSLIVEFDRAGVSVEQMAEWYPHVSPAAIRGALEYYAEHPERVDEDIERQERAWAEIIERNVLIQGRP